MAVGAWKERLEENVMLWEDENWGYFYIPLWAFAFLIFSPSDNALLFLFRKEKVISKRGTCGLQPAMGWKHLGIKAGSRGAGFSPGMASFLCRFPLGPFYLLCLVLIHSSASWEPTSSCSWAIRTSPAGSQPRDLATSMPTSVSGYNLVQISVSGYTLVQISRRETEWFKPSLFHQVKVCVVTSQSITGCPGIRCDQVD